MELSEILSRLQILGGTTVGGDSQYANFLPILNSNGELDPSFFANTLLNHVWDAADQTERLALTNLKIGDIVVQADNSTAYVLADQPSTTSGNWRVIGSAYANSGSGVAFSPTGTNLISTNVQDALVELWTKALVVDANRTVTGNITYNVTGAAPFIIGAGSQGQLVAGLNADLLDGQHGSYYRNAANINAGILPTDRLSGTYPISISGTAAVAATSISAQNADVAALANNATHADDATHADLADAATTATQANTLHDGISYRPGSYFLDAGNLNAGIIPANRFNDLSHGERAGGYLHSLATTTTAGFLSADDKTKLNSIEDGAEINQNAFSIIQVGVDNIVANVQESTLKIASLSPEIEVSADVPNKTVNIAFNLQNLDHSDLGGLNADDHLQYVHKSVARTITAVHTLNPTVISPAFILGPNAVGRLIPGLNAEKLEGNTSAYFRNASNINAGTLARPRLSGTYDINITGTATGGVSTDGDSVIDGIITVNSLIASNLAGTGERIVMADATGMLITGATTDNLPEGIVNRWYNDSKVRVVIGNTLVNSDTINWEIVGDTYAPELAATTDDIPEGTTNKYVTWDSVKAVLALGDGLLYDGGNDEIKTDHTTTATANKLVMRDGSGNIAANDATLADITVESAILSETATLLQDTDSDRRLADKAYVDKATTNHIHDSATYDWPVVTTTDRTSLNAKVGEVAIQDDLYYVLTKLPASNSANWQQIDLPAYTQAKDGFITSKDRGDLLKFAMMADSKVASNVFCPTIQLSETIKDEVDGLDNYKDKNWVKRKVKNVKVRGRKGKKYFALLHARGWVKKQHEWSINYIGATDENPITKALSLSRTTSQFYHSTNLRNPNNWANLGGIDLSCTIPNYHNGNLWPGTLVTPRHVIGAAHNTPPFLPRTISFVTRDSRVIQRDIIDVASVEMAYLTGMSISNQGSGYTSAPTILISTTTGAPTGATATCTVLDGKINTVTLTNPGSFNIVKTGQPVIILSGGGGTGAVLGCNWYANDICVSLLNADIGPEDIPVLPKLLPPDWTTVNHPELLSYPIVFVDTGGQTFDRHSNEPQPHIEYNEINLISPEYKSVSIKSYEDASIANDPDKYALADAGITGDSGSGWFTIINGELIGLTSFFGTQGGPAWHLYATEINNTMDALDTANGVTSGYRMEVIDATSAKAFDIGNSYPCKQIINSFTSEQPSLDSNGDVIYNTEYEYVDKYIPIVVEGKSNLALSFVAYDGKFTDKNDTVLFPGLAPYVKNGEKDNFDGGFINIECKGVWSANPNEPFNPYSPDIFPIVSEGELISGGHSYYPEDISLDNRVYDGEDIPNKGVTKFTSSSSGLAGNPIYVIDQEAEEPTIFEKNRLNNSYSLLNKMIGFSGFLRGDNVVTSGPGLSQPITTSTNSTTINSVLSATPLTYSGFTADIPTTDFSIGNVVVSMAGVTNFKLFIDAIKNTSGINSSGTYYDSTSDRLVISFNTPASLPEDDVAPPIQYPDKHPLNTLRVSFGPEARHVGVSLPVVTGIRLNTNLDQLLLKNKLTLPVIAGNNTPGKFYVDDLLIEYGNSSNLQSIFSKINDTDKYSVTYNKVTNEVEVSKISTDADSLNAPRIYDVRGNLAACLGLDKESHGNKDLPPEAVHSLLYTDKGILVGGSFKNFEGVSLSGIAKVDFYKKADELFNPGAGFDVPIYNIAEAADSSGDILVAGTEWSSYEGYNKRAVHRLNAAGEEIKQEVSGDMVPVFNITEGATHNQNRILGVLPFSTGDTAVLTPRQLIIYTPTGTKRATYSGNRSFHGMTKYKVEGDNTLFILASTAYESPTITQKFNNIGEPLGLKLLAYNHTSKTVTIDPVWASIPVWVSGERTEGAGTGAEASCAYPVIGGVYGDNPDPFVVCGNRGSWWNSEIETDPGNVSWDERGVGNLLLQSQTLGNGSGGTTSPWSSIGSLTTTNSTSGVQPLTILSNSALDESQIGAIYQDVDVTQYNPFSDVPPIANPGKVVYRFSIDVLQDAVTDKYPYIGLHFGNGFNNNVNLSNEFDIHCLLNTSTGAISTSIPGGITATITSVNNYNLAGIPVYTITFIVEDKNIANYIVSPVIYPAYTATFTGGSKVLVYRQLTVVRASLAYNIWSNNTYVDTTTTKSLPASTISSRFKGLYKVMLENGKRGHSDPDFEVEFTYSEKQAHAIPFAVDKQNRIYVGGPISAIKDSNGDMIAVTPWRLYRLTEDGAFDKEYKFDDVVTCALITPQDQLVVGGKFDNYERRAVGKLVYLTLDGDVLENIAQIEDDVIVSPIEPNVSVYPENKDKIWLDTSTEPPVPKVYDDINNIWVSALAASKRITDPVFMTTPVGVTVDPSRIDLRVTGFTVKASDLDCTPNSKHVVINYYINSTATSPLVYNPTNGILLPNAGTYTIYAEAIAPVDNDWYPSKIVSKTFVVRDQTAAPSISTSGATDAPTVTITNNQVGVTTVNLSYYTYTPGNPPATPVWLPYTVPFQLNTTQIVVAKAQADNRRESVNTEATVTVILGNVTLTRTGSNSLTNFTTGLAANVTGILYSVGAYDGDTLDGGTEPTMANYNNGVAGLIYVNTTNVDIDMLDHSAFGSGNKIKIKARGVNLSAATSKVVAESAATTTMVIERMPAVTFDPDGYLVKNGNGDYYINFGGVPVSAAKVNYAFDALASPAIPVANTVTSAPFRATVSVASLTYNNFSLRARIVDNAGSPTKIAGPATLRNYVWRRQAASVALQSYTTSTYGYTGFKINPNSRTNTIKYQLDPNGSLSRANNEGIAYVLGAAGDGSQDPVIDLQNVPDSYFVYDSGTGEDKLTIRVLEVNSAEDSTLDTIGVTSVYRVTRNGLYSGLKFTSNGATALSESSNNTASQLTYNPTNSTWLYMDYTENHAKIAYNNAELITASLATDVTHNYGDSSPNGRVSFTPGVGAVNSGSLTIKTRFFKTNRIPSRVITLLATMKMPVVTFSANTAAREYDVTLTNNLSTAIIYYSLDNSSPTTRAYRYDKPIAIRSTTTVYAIAVKTGWATSDVASQSYVTSPTNYNQEKSYQLINIQFGNILDEREVLKTSATRQQAVLEAALLTGDPTEIDIPGTLDVEDTNTIAKCFYGDALIGITQGPSAGDLDAYWNRVNEENGQNWVLLRDSLGSRNSSAVLKARSYFNTTDAPKYFGVSGNGQITSLSEDSITSSLENTAIISKQQDSIMAEVQGLLPGKYLLVAYGEKTKFDLDMATGTCLSKNTGKAFYEYGPTLFDLAKYTNLNFSTPVFPVRTYKVKAVQKETVGSSTQIKWVVDANTINTTYVPRDWWLARIYGAGSLKNQTFLNDDDLSVASNKGIIYVPTLAEDGYEGFLGSSGSFEITRNIVNDNDTALYAENINRINYVNSEYKQTGTTDTYGFKDARSLGFVYSRKFFDIARQSGYTTVQEALTYVRATSVPTEVLVNGQRGFNVEVSVYNGSTFNNYTVFYVPASTLTPVFDLTTSVTQAYANTIDASWGVVSSTPIYDYTTKVHTIGASRTSITNKADVVFSGGWEFVAIAPAINSGNELDPDSNYVTQDATSDLSLILNKLLLAADRVYNKQSPFTDIGPQSSILELNPAISGATAEGMLNLLVSDLGTSNINVEWPNATPYEAFGLQVNKEIEYQPNTANLTGDITTNSFVIPLSITQQPTALNLASPQDTNVSGNTVPLYCIEATNGSGDTNVITNGSIEVQVDVDPSNKPLNFNWYVASNSTANGSLIDSNSADYAIVTDVNSEYSRLVIINPTGVKYYYCSITTTKGATQSIITNRIGVRSYVTGGLDPIAPVIMTIS